MPVTINGTTGISGVDGSASTPAVQGTDTNTGIAFPAADTVTVATGGSERMRVDSSGRVGIGVSSPTWRLEVAGNNGSEFKVSRGTNEFGVSLSNNAGSVVYVGAVADSPLALMTNATERMRITSSGNVGINTTSPAYQLDINNASSYSTIGLRQGGTLYGFIEGGISQVKIGTNAAIPMLFEINGVERGRFTSGGDFQFNSGYGSVATAYGCRSWVNFNGTGTVSIRASGNVSSITDNGTGDYTVNFSTAMTDANYAGVSGMTNDGSTGTNNPRVAEMVNTSSSAMRMVCMDSASGTAGDMNSVYVAIFR